MRRFLKAALLAAALCAAGSSAAYAQAGRPLSADLTQGSGGYAFDLGDPSSGTIQPGYERHKGVTALKAKRYRQAVIALGRLTDAAPNDPVAFRLLGAAYAGQQRWDASRRAYAHAVQLDPSEITGHAGLGLAMLALNDPRAQAQNDWLKARTAACNNACPEAGILQALATRGPFASPAG